MKDYIPLIIIYK